MTEQFLAVDVDGLLEGLPGVAYAVDRAGIVAAVGGIDWFRLADGHDTGGLAPERFVGRSLFDTMSSDAVRRAARRAHDRVLQVGVERLDYPYRCDAPDCARFCRMTMTPIPGASGIVGVLYHSQIIEAYDRPALGAFDAKVKSRDAAALLNVICSYCQRFVWPTGARGAERTWIEAEEFHRRGGSDVAGASHGVCPTCLSMLVGSAEPAASPRPDG